MADLELLSKRLIEVRKQHGYTRKQLAEELGKPYRTITNYETGEHEPGHKYLIEIAKKFGVTVDYLVGRSDNPYPDAKSAPPYSEEALKLAGDYDKQMDDRGRETVRVVADLEVARFKARAVAALRKSRERSEAAEEIAPETVFFLVPGFVSAASAGLGQPAENEYAENFKLTREPPYGTSYIIRVSGDSMEPTYRHGELVFVHAQNEIPAGKIGIFFMDGQQWIKELGNGVLISHNQAPEYAPRTMTDDVVCQGLVLGVCDDSYFE